LKTKPTGFVETVWVEVGEGEDAVQYAIRFYANGNVQDVRLAGDPEEDAHPIDYLDELNAAVKAARAPVRKAGKR
jgi:predicted TIM-barrel fold metal-dependent hydrolase